MSQPNVQHVRTSLFGAFWQSFRLFPWRFEQFGFTHWYFFGIGYLLVAFLLDLLTDVRTMYLVHGLHQLEPFYQDFDTTTHDLVNNWLLYTLGVAGIVGVVFFNRWWQRIPKTLQGVLNKGLVCSRSTDRDMQQEYQRFLTDYQRILLSTRRYLFIGVFVAIIMLFSLLQAMPAIAERRAETDPVLLLLGWLTIVLKIILVTAVVSYFLGVAIWITSVSGWSIRSLTAKFDLLLQPQHPDHCGGLKSLGTFCLGMALPILVGAGLLGVYSVGSIFYPLLVNNQSIVRTLAEVGLVVIALPLATITFFVPLWDIHQKMLDGKEAYEAALIARIAELDTRSAALEKHIWSFLDAGKLQEAKTAKDERDIIQALYPTPLVYPVWPFDLRILLTFLVPQIIPILGLVLPLVVHP